MTVKSSILSDRQKAVIETIRLRLSERQSLEYLKEMGFDISPKTYYNDKRKVESLKLKRLYHIAKIGFEDQHLETIDELNVGFRIMWKNVLREQSPYRQNQMIKDILLLKPYLSAYYESTKLIIDKQKSEYKEFLDKQIQEQEDDEEEELNGDTYGKYQHQESTTLTNTEFNRSLTNRARSTDYDNKNRKF